MNVWDEIAESWNEARQAPYPPQVFKISEWKGKILDVGCGNGRNLSIFKDCELFGLDYSEKMIEFAKKFCEKHQIEAKFVVSDFRKLPFDDKSFDYTISTASLHHVDKEECVKALKEIKRVTKKKVFLTVWNREPKGELIEPWTHKGKEHLRYHYIYKEKEFIEIMESVGFKIEENLTDEKNIVIIAGVA